MPIDASQSSAFGLCRMNGVGMDGVGMDGVAERDQKTRFNQNSIGLFCVRGVCGVDYHLQLDSFPSSGARAAIEGEERIAGGAPFHVTRLLTLAGERVCVTVPYLSEDSNGRFVRRELQSLNVTLDAPLENEMRETPYRVLLQTPGAPPAILWRPIAATPENFGAIAFSLPQSTLENRIAPRAIVMDDGADYDLDRDVGSARAWLQRWPQAPLFLRIRNFDSPFAVFIERAACVWLCGEAQNYDEGASHVQLPQSEWETLRRWSLSYRRVEFIFRSVESVLSLGKDVWISARAGNIETLRCVGPFIEPWLTDSAARCDDAWRIWAALILNFER